MTHGYEPLHLPAEETSRKSWLAEFLGRGSGAEHGKSLVAQLKARDSIPPEVWGPDPARQRLGAIMSKAAAEVIYWSNAYFVPEDPLKLVLFALPDGREDMETTEFMRMIEPIIGWHVDDDLFVKLYEMTLGEVVDTLLERSPGFRERVRLALPVPLKGPEALEARPCPSLAAFLSFRAYALTWGLTPPARKICPSTHIRGAFRSDILRQFDDLVRDRFGVDARLADTAEENAVATGCLGVMTALSGGICWRLWSNIINEGWGWHVVPRQAWAILLGLATPVLLCLFLGSAYSALRQYLSRIAGAVGIGQRPRIVTFADLVRWVVSERAKQAHLVQAAE